MVMNAEADSFVCYSKWSERRDGADESDGAFVVYYCGTCVNNLRKMAKNSAKIIWFCFMLPVGKNVTNTPTSRSLGKWRGKALKLLMKLRTEMEADFFLQVALIKFIWCSLFRMPLKNLSLSKKVYVCTSAAVNQVQRVVRTWMFAAADTKYCVAYEREFVTKYPICSNLSK